MHHILDTIQRVRNALPALVDRAPPVAREFINDDETFYFI
jgi:hypothetical protein